MQGMVDATKADFANLLGMKPTRWNNLESGYPCTIQIARLIKEKIPGVTIAYIYEGITTNVPTDMVEKLKELDRSTKRKLAKKKRAKHR